MNPIERIVLKNMDMTCLTVRNQDDYNHYITSKWIDSLEELYWRIDEEIPFLPSKLKILDCNGVRLTSLPSLPESLEYLNCENNPIKQIPPLPKSLKEAHFDDNVKIYGEDSSDEESADLKISNP